MESIISALFLITTLLAYILVAAYASRGVQTKEDYLLGNRQFNIFSITLTLIATQVGAGMLFGTALEAYEHGFLGLAYIFGMALGLLVLGLGVGAKLRDLNINTTAELFETKYNSPRLRKLAAIISILTMGGILAAQIVASRQLFASLFDLNPLWLIAFWLIIIIYTMAGGIKAIIATDILQVLIIVIAFSVVLFVVIPFNKFPEILLLGAIKQNQPLFKTGFFAAIIAPALYSLIEQDLAQRFFAAKTRRVATISALLAAVFLLIFALVPMSLGIYAKLLGLSFAAGESPMIVLLQAKLSSLGMTIVSCALLAAICSTADSLLGAASTNLIADFSFTNEKNSLFFSKFITFLVGISALFIAFNFDSIIGVILKSYEISISALFVPLMLAMYLKNPSKLGAYFSVSFGLLAFFLAHLFDHNISTMLVSLLASSMGYIIGAMLTSTYRQRKL